MSEIELPITNIAEKILHFIDFNEFYNSSKANEYCFATS